jgi:exodeoxyribonuclease VII small subunit
MATEEQELTYDKAMAEIERILVAFRNETMSVDKLATEVRRATTLIAYCRERLRKAEADVKEITEG